jgi:endonuclease/exonuclease/phosphatase family metal-dependent hydrolase
MFSCVFWVLLSLGVSSRFDSMRQQNGGTASARASTVKGEICVISANRMHEYYFNNVTDLCPENTRVLVLATQEAHGVATWVQHTLGVGTNQYFHLFSCAIKQIGVGAYSAKVSILVKPGEIDKFTTPAGWDKNLGQPISGGHFCHGLKHSPYTVTGTAKSTAILKVQHATLGNLVVASSHLDRSGKKTVKQFTKAAKELKKLSHGFNDTVIWAGDFNQRTPTGTRAIDEQTEATPDNFKSLMDRFSQDTNDERTTEEVLQAAPVQGRLQQAPGLFKLCPTYYKEKQTDAAWKCTGPNGVEYYKNDRTKTRVPSWPDRIFVSNGVACQDMKKLVRHADHDPVSTTCEISA